MPIAETSLGNSIPLHSEERNLIAHSPGAYTPRLHICLQKAILVSNAYLHSGVTPWSMWAEVECVCHASGSSEQEPGEEASGIKQLPWQGH